MMFGYFDVVAAYVQRKLKRQISDYCFNLSVRLLIYIQSWLHGIVNVTMYVPMRLDYGN